MPQQAFRDFIRAQLEAAAATSSEKERRLALRQFFYAVLSEVAEDVIDKEMVPVNGTPVQPQFTLRPESSYYPYNLARADGYAAFTEEQKAILRGLIMRTAFEVLDRIFYKLDFMPGSELEIRVHSHVDGTETIIRSRELEELQYGRNQIPQGLTKYEM